MFLAALDRFAIRCTANWRPKSTGKHFRPPIISRSIRQLPGMKGERDENYGSKNLVVLHAGAGVIGKQAYQVFSGPALLSAQSSISSEAQVQLEVQSYTGSAGQIFALDGDSIILAEDRNLVVEVQNNRGANGTPLVLGRRDLADSEFWTFSATDDSTRRPTSGFAHVSETRDFVNAVATANPGTVIEVDPSATINLKDQPPLRIPAGVTIRGDRRG